MDIFEDIEADITPTEFEKLCLDLLMKTKGFENLDSVAVEHNKIIKTHDGTYQLDGWIEFFMLNVKHKVIVECKQHKNAIKREDIVILKDKMQSLAANKGILMATSGFQKGAKEYAKEHGIGLIRVNDRNMLTIQASAVSQEDKDKLLQRYLAMPKHFLFMYDLDYNLPIYNLNKDLGKFREFLCSK